MWARKGEVTRRPSEVAGKVLPWGWTQPPEDREGHIPFGKHQALLPLPKSARHIARTSGPAPGESQCAGSFCSPPPQTETQKALGLPSPCRSPCVSCPDRGGPSAPPTSGGSRASLGLDHRVRQSSLGFLVPAWH